MEFQGVFTIGESENLRYRYYTSRGKMGIGLALVFVVLLFTPGLLKYGASKEILGTLLSSLPLALGVVAFMLALVLLVTYRRIHKLYQTNAFSEFELRIKLNASGVSASSVKGDEDWTWDQLEGVSESAKDFFLFIPGRRVYVLSKKQLPRQEDAALIHDILKAYAKDS